MRRIDTDDPKAPRRRELAKNRARRYRARQAKGITLPPREPVDALTLKQRNCVEARRYRERVRTGQKVPTPKPKTHSVPEITPHEVEGRTGYWRAVHANGLVQIVQGTRARALREVRKQVSRLNEFEAWCRAHSVNDRLRLL